MTRKEFKSLDKEDDNGVGEWRARDSRVRRRGVVWEDVVWVDSVQENMEWVDVAWLYMVEEDAVE